MPDDVALWVTNGTAGGTRQLLRPLIRMDDNMSPVFATGEGVVLTIHGESLEPWFTRGTVATTGQLASISPNSFRFATGEFTRSGSRVFFRTLDDTDRNQLWSVPASFTCPPGPTQAR